MRGTRGEEGLDTDLMHSIEDANKSLASNIAQKDSVGAAADVQELARLFPQVETYFEHKGGAEDAVTLARRSMDLAERIRTAVGDRDFDAAQTQATDLSRTCKSCHNFYKKE